MTVDLARDVYFGSLLDHDLVRVLFSNSIYSTLYLFVSFLCDYKSAEVFIMTVFECSVVHRNAIANHVLL